MVSFNIEQFIILLNRYHHTRRSMTRTGRRDRPPKNHWEPPQTPTRSTSVRYVLHYRLS